MKGFIKKTLATLSLAGGLTFFAGCHGASLQEGYYGCVDPCWPQRYSAMASDSVNAAFAPQVANGHVLDQTIWNYHFEKGTAILTPAGREHLAILAKRRPSPDPRIFLQTSYDIVYDEKIPGKFADERNKLDNARTQALYNFLQAHTAGRGVAFNVTVHDPSEVGMGSVPMLSTISTRDASFKGVLLVPTVAPIAIGGGR